MAYTNLPATDGVTVYDAARDQHIQQGISDAHALAGEKAARAANLSDLPSAASARTNLGLGSAAVMSPGQLAADPAFTGAFQPLVTPTVAGLTATAPWYVAHRGCGDVRPEHTLAAYEGAVSDGAKAVEVSVWPTLDGQLVCHHDQTLDRTTNLTGDITTRTAAYLRNAGRVDVGAQLLGAGWADQPISSLSEVLGSIGGRTVVFAESKAGTTTAGLRMLAMLSGVPKDSIVYKVYRLAPSGGLSAAALAAKAAGYKVWAYLDAEDAESIVDATIAAGADMLGVPTGGSDGWIQMVVGKGRPVMAWEVHRRWERDRLSALGVQGMMCPGISYVTRSTAFATSSLFGEGVAAPGDLPWDQTVHPVTWDAANSAVVLAASGTNSSLMLGSLSPVANAAGTYRVTWQQRWATLPTATTHSDFVFGHADDRRYGHQNANNADGYHVVFRGNGNLELFTHQNGSTSGTQIGATVTTAAPTAGAWCSFQLDVTPTTITLQRTDVASTAINVGNTAYRGGYLHVAQGSANTPAAFRNVVVS